VKTTCQTTNAEQEENRITPNSPKKETLEEKKNLSQK